MSRRSPLRLAATAALLLAPALAPLTLAAAPASAALPPGCNQTSPGADVVCTYTAAKEHVFTVPAGVTSVTATAIGGHGTTYRDVGHGGRGARVTATLSVVGSATLYVEVAGNGGDGSADRIGQGGANGGGNGVGSGGGGGASDVRTVSKSGRADESLASRRLVGGGGGGGAIDPNVAGGDAGAAGVPTAPTASAKVVSRARTSRAAIPAPVATSKAKGERPAKAGMGLPAGVVVAVATTVVAPAATPGALVPVVGAGRPTSRRRPRTSVVRR